MENTDEKAAHQLRDVRQWAQAKIDSGQEPPWSWFQYMKLIETIDTILGANAVTTGNSQQLAQHQGTRLQLVDSKYQQDNALPQTSDVPVKLPM